MLDIGPLRTAEVEGFEPPADLSYEIFLCSINLMIRRPLLNEPLLRNHLRLLENSPARYYFTKQELAWHAIPVGVAYDCTSEIFSSSNSLPMKLCVRIEHYKMMPAVISKSVCDNFQVLRFFQSNSSTRRFYEIYSPL